LSIAPFPSDGGLLQDGDVVGPAPLIVYRSMAFSEPLGYDVCAEGRRRMKKLIEIVDLISGLISNRKPETLTLDVPTDLDRQTGGVSIDSDRIVRYFAVGASRRLYIGQPRRLSARMAGEQCLVAVESVDTQSFSWLRRYSLAVVK
jgi:hypothetical protein